MKLVSYYRVSTTRQGRSGLGLEGQREAVRQYIGDDNYVVDEFVEIESGRSSGRPQLKRAIEACKAWKAKLVIAKLDRLSRNVAFISALMDSDIEFIAVDFPNANRLTLHILAAVAEHEAVCISTRTREALGCAKARGRSLGGYRGTVPSDCCRSQARVSVRKSADQRLLAVWPIIFPLIGGDPISRSRLAGLLNLKGIPTFRDGANGWGAVQVGRMLEHASRLGLLSVASPA